MKRSEKMDVIKLTIRSTEEYRERSNKARESEDLRKCRSWIDLLKPTDENVEVEIDLIGITLRCNTRNGSVQDSCTYDSVLAVTEMRDGVLLRLSHKRLLWLPVSEDAQENGSLMEAMLILCEHCRSVFRTGHLKLKGIGLVKKIAFRVRPRQGYNTADGFVKGVLIALICVSFFIATVFVSQLFQNRKIDEQDAVVITAVFESTDPVYGRSSRKYLDLQFRDIEEQTIDGCCLGSSLRKKLESIPSGTRMRLLIHPDSGNVLQIEVAGETLLDFDYARDQLWKEAIAFAILGLFMFACGIYFTVAMIWKKI